MLTSIHVLLTYKCLFECDHCFLFCGPNTNGTFTSQQIHQLLTQAVQVDSIDSIFFEGGEPFLFYPLLLQSLETAHKMGFKTGIVTNGYFATSKEDAVLWFKPLADLAVDSISISCDDLHYEDSAANCAENAISAAQSLGLAVDPICLQRPSLKQAFGSDEIKVDGDIRFRGRAVEKLAAELPKTPWQNFRECPYEDLQNPDRVHIDPFGNVHLCQGLCMGNIWQTPLVSLLQDYHPQRHPVCSYLVAGGPVQLAQKYQLSHESKYVDACHFCFDLRLKLINKFPNYLTPKQVYGL